MEILTKENLVGAKIAPNAVSRTFTPLVRRISGQRTEQVKTGQVNPDHPLVGPSVDTFVGCFVGSP